MEKKYRATARCFCCHPVLSQNFSQISIGLPTWKKTFILSFSAFLRSCSRKYVPTQCSTEFALKQNSFPTFLPHLYRAQTSRHSVPSARGRASARLSSVATITSRQYSMTCTRRKSSLSSTHASFNLSIYL